MIITIVCDVLGKENNGTTVAAMNLIRFLKSQGHTVRILCADKDKKGQENVFVVPNYNFGKILNAYVEKVGVTLAKPQKDIIVDALTGVDIVHIMVPLSLGLATAKIAREMDIPITAGFHMQAENLTSHFKMNKSKLINNQVYKFIYRHLYKYTMGIHYPTEFIRHTFESNIKKTTPGYVISNGVNEYVKPKAVPKPDEYKNKIVIASIGRFGREKSQDTLIKAMKYSKYADKIQLIFGGQGPKEKYYRRLSKKLPIQPVFKFFTREDIADVINYCDIYAHTADIELEGIACLEAIVCGKFTIVSNSKLSATKGFAVDERCIFKKRNPKDLARVIDYWIEHPKDREICAKKYLESANNYNQLECMKKMEAMLLEVIQKHKDLSTNSQNK